MTPIPVPETNLLIIIIWSHFHRFPIFGDFNMFACNYCSVCKLLQTISKRFVPVNTELEETERKRIVYEIDK